VSEVIIIGGGLTGISAAWELEQRRIPYRLIEVKNRLGGSIVTKREAGFTLDGSAFVLEKYGDWPFLAELGLSEADALVPVGRYRDGQLVIFRDGTQTLVDAIERRLTAPIMQRMAVSSIGQLGAGRFEICLENGLALNARAVIVTAPARYAEHMLRALAPEAALLLLDYRYDPVVRVSLGYPRDAVPTTLPDASALKFLQRYDMPERVPSEHVLIRAGVRMDDSIKSPDDAIRRVRALFDAEPVAQWTYYWPEADSLSRYLPEHTEAMDRIDALLPVGVALAGSDYRARRLDQQVAQGRAAAAKVAQGLR
jgi:protoporphyrinogen oxidase